MEELNEKDLYCIAKHIQEFIRKNWCKDENYKGSCYDCKFNKDCAKNGFTHIDTFIKLENITGVKISLALGKKSKTF